MLPPWIYALGASVLVLGAAYSVRNQINGLVGVGAAPLTTKPTLWWYVDDSQVNARQWLDWGNRSTREPNEPYLRICLQRARDLWGHDFDIQPIVGREAALSRVKGPEGAAQAPPALWMPWCRAAFLSTYGGLWLDGSVLPMGADLRQRLGSTDALMFGADPEEALSTAAATGPSSPAAGLSAGWAAMPAHPVWSALERDLGALIGSGAPSWSAAEARRSLRTLWERICSGTVRVDRAAEVSRDRYGRRLELDTLLGQTEWPDSDLTGGLWLVWPDGRDGLERASHWAWFLRLSEDQIRESDFVWAKWATKYVGGK